MLAFEKLEAVRNAHYLKEGGVLIINDYRIEPTYLNKAAKYPDDPIGFLKSRPIKVLVMNATETARALGNERVASLMMLGAVSRFLPLRPDSWDKVLRERIPARFLKLNQQAFEEGQKKTF